MDTVLLSVHHKGNRHLLREWLESRYAVIEADASHALDQPFDLRIVDAVALVQCEADILAHKQKQAPLFMPTLLIVQRKDVGLATRNLWKSVDDLIISPIEKIELQARVHNLILARRLSLDLRAREEELLQSSEERYRRLFDANADALFVLDSSGHILDANRVAETRYGYSRAELLTMTVGDLAAPDLRDQAGERVRQSLAEGAQFEWRHMRKDGSELPVEIGAVPIAFNGQSAILSSVRDITERKQAQEALRESEQKYSIVFNKAPYIAALARVTDGAIVEINEEFERALGYSRQEALGKTSFELGLYPNPEERKQAGALVEQQGSVRNLEMRVRTKSGELRTFLFNTDIVEIGGERYFLSTAQDITERKQAEKALNESEKRNRLIAEMISDYAYIFLVTPAGELKGEWVTESFTKAFGYTLTEVQARGGWLTLVYPEDLPAARAHVRKVVNGESDICEMRWTTARGEIRWLRDYAKPIFDETGKRVVRIYGASQDITERKRAEEALQKSEERLKHVLANAPDTIYSLDFSTGKTTFLNREEFCGYSRAEMEAPGSLLFAVHPDDVGVLKEHWTQMREEKNVKPLSYRLRKKDGTWAWIEQRVRVLAYKPDGKPKEVLVSLSDITERKQAEEKVRESEEKFSNAFNVGPAAMTITRITDGKIIDANESFFNMFGFTREEVIGHTSLELNMLTPDQRRVLIQEQLKAGGLRNAELLAKTKSGAPIHLLFSSKPMQVEGEECFLTTLIDITDRKRAEEELRLSRDRLAELSKKLLEAREAESRAIGRELHDEIGQMLTALKLTLEIAPRLPSEAAAKKYAQAQELVGELMNGVSRLTLELRPPMLDDLGLLPALLWHLDRFTRQTGIRVDFKHAGIEGKRFTKEVETAAYRIVQESLTNIARHAGVDQVTVQVTATRPKMKIHVEDRGRGFEVESALAAGHGLAGMRERVRLLNGEFRVESVPGAGTRLDVTLPLPRS